MAGDDTNRLLELLSTGDVELHFHDDRTIKAHALKLKSLNGILMDLMEDLVEEQIAERRRTDSEAETIPIKVREYSWYAAVQVSPNVQYGRRGQIV